MNSALAGSSKFEKANFPPKLNLKFETVLDITRLFHDKFRCKLDFTVTNPKIIYKN